MVSAYVRCKAEGQHHGAKARKRTEPLSQSPFQQPVCPLIKVTHTPGMRPRRRTQSTDFSDHDVKYKTLSFVSASVIAR